MYMDDDATFNMKLDKVVKPNDKFIVGKKRIDDAPYNLYHGSNIILHCKSFT